MTKHENYAPEEPGREKKQKLPESTPQDAVENAFNMLKNIAVAMCSGLEGVAEDNSPKTEGSEHAFQTARESFYALPAEVKLQAIEAFRNHPRFSEEILRILVPDAMNVEPASVSNSHPRP